MSEQEPVLVVGATGSLGGQVVDRLLDRGKKVRALVRPSSDAGKLEAKGVEIARGDMLDLDSLVAAMTGAAAVITTAAGYTGKNKNAHEIDTRGNANLAIAASKAGVPRFVLTSILTSDQTPECAAFLAQEARRGQARRTRRPVRGPASRSIFRSDRPDGR